MGNNSGKTEEALMENYQLLSTERDKRFGEIAIYKNRKTGELVWIKDLVVEDEASQKHYEQYLTSNKHSDEVFISANANFIEASGASHFCGGCAGGRKLVVVMEFYERDLEGEIIRRGEDLDYFPEAEIWYIIEAVMRMEKHILGQNRAHGDLRSAGIFITEDGVAKFYDPILLGYRQNAYTKTLLEISNSPLPPELMETLRQNQTNPKFDPQATEAWAIGILALSLATLSSEEVMYDWGKKKMEKNIVESLIHQAGERYSKLFHHFLTKCLDFNPRNRPNLPEIYQYLTKRKTEIS